MKTPEQFYNQYNGKAVNKGNGWNDSAFGYQCVAGYKAFDEWAGLPVKATPNGWADGYWYSRDSLGFGKYFDYITDSKEYKNGDWVIWARGSKSHPKSHIAMYYNGKEFGQNQGAIGFNLISTTFSDSLGALRWKEWSASLKVPYGSSEIVINNRKYFLYRQNPNTETFAVLSAGINKVLPISKLDAQVNVMSKITGANYFQNDPNNPAGQPVGMTFGDLSSPLNDVWRQLPNQDSTLYFDMETGVYGDCTGINIDRTHNVFSPAVVYPYTGNFQYATMVGVRHIYVSSVYTFSIRLTDGTYVLGLAEQESTPKQIADDFKSKLYFDSISFLDGGGSAQMMRYIASEHKVEYTRETTRDVPSAVAIIQKDSTVTQPVEPANPSEDDENKKDEEIPMADENKQEQPEIKPVEGWSDPEPQTSIIVERIASLLSVKSILTIALTVVFAYLVMNQIAIPDFFTDIYKIVVLFFFGYQTGKAENK